MEQSISLLLGLVITISLATVAILHMTNYAANLSDDYAVISHARLYEDSSISVITITYTNNGILPIVSFEGMIPSCNCSLAKVLSVKPHTSSTVSWHEFSKDVSGIIHLSYTFEDGIIITDIQKLRS